jgi:hypothetical protein
MEFSGVIAKQAGFAAALILIGSDDCHSAL